MNKGIDLQFQGHAIKIEHITIGFLDPENIPKNIFTKKVGREVRNPVGVATTPLAANVGRNSLVVNGLTEFRLTYL